MTTGDKPSAGNRAAFPYQYEDEKGDICVCKGMTYRQWLIGQIASGRMENIDSAGWVIRAADAILAELDKERGER